ncbi:MAG: OMPP1/FadL/TodX family outer membrane transport protein, long-chain fatty acid transport protein [Deltaproteobacteria bacterium CSP1-8]|nr:MAG: OMPP1/FadL/TodX family outer membrane transport protein, long-chain fatty acid transport protein [Deltaproteobacteria bacterium CSP1-8]
MRIGKVLAFLVVLLFAATSAMAGGFRLPEAGAKAMSMGFAFTAQANDPSAIYFNPAGIVQLEGNNVKVGVTYIKENGGTFTGITPLTGGASVSETQKDLDFFVPNAFITRKASPNFAYGVGIFSPFGLGQEYENRNTSIFRSQITKIDLMTLVVNPTVAWKVNEFLSVGAGIDFMYGKAELARTPVGIDNATGFPANIFNSGLEGDGTAWGYNFGVLLTPTKQLKIGVAYRSKFDLEIKDGDVDLSNVFSGNINTPLGPLPPQGPAPIGFGGPSFNTTGSATLHIPATLDLGVAYILDRLTLEVDASWTFWHSWKSLNIDNKDNRAFLPDTSSPKNWDDVVAIYIGGEYRVTDPLALRLGFRWDPTPVPAETMGPELPDADKLYYCAGAGYKVRNWTFDLAYMYVDKKDRTENNLRTEGGIPVGFNGKWTGDAHLVAFDIGYKF